MYSIDHWIDKRAAMNPNRIAFIDENGSLTYQQASQKIQQIAQHLKFSLHVNKGDRIAILSMNSVEYVLTLFAIAKLECIAVPLNIRLTPPELAYQLNDSGTRFLIAELSFGDTIEALQTITNVEQILWIEREELFGEFKNTISDFIPPHELHSDEPFIICYTSGTTGKPKGAVLTQENMFWNAINSNLGLDITSEDRVMTLLPLFHIGGIGLFTLPTLFTGGTVILPHKFDPTKALQMIKEYQVTITMGVPTMFDTIRKSSNFKPEDLRSIRWFYSGGAPCPEELINYYLNLNIPFGQGFGMTEAAPTIFLLTRDDYQNKQGSIGRATLFCDIRIADDYGNDVKANEVGELWITGPNIFKEYWNLPEETNQSFIGKWLKTGDLAKRDEEGFVYIVGRKKEMIISGGENIYPIEIEQVIQKLEEVEYAAVIRSSDEKWGEIPVAVITLNEGAHLTEEALLNHCQRYLAKYKIPKKFHIVEALPLNAAGKIHKAKISEQFA